MVKDQGFILKKTNFSETSAIVHIYTLKKGLMSFYFPGAQKKKQALLRPLAHISFQYRQRNEEQMPMLTQPEEEHLWKNIYFDPVKSCQLYFINEVLHNTMVQQDPDPALFQFILDGMHFFDQENKTSNFHIFFLAQLTRFLGFYPEINHPVKTFDLYNGILGEQHSQSKLFETGPSVTGLHYFFTSGIEEHGNLALNGNQRNLMAQILIKYYQTQLDGFYPPKSLEILETIFS